MRPAPRAAWSLVELLVVISILVALIAMGFAIWSMVRTRAAIGSTQSLVTAVATQITTYNTKVRLWTWQDGGGATRSEHVFDLNHDGLIDGRPGVTASDTNDGGFPSEVIASGYQGYVAMTGDDRGRSATGRNQQPLDAWKRPLRIAFAARIYGTGSFGIWSAGPDGIDGTADDVTSWQRTP